MDAAERDRKREREALREGARTAARTAATYVPMGMIVLVGIVYLLADAVTSGNKLLGDQHEWFNAAMPAVLFGLFGGVFGCLLGWRMAGTSGLTGPVAWGIGMGGLAVLLVCGMVCAALVYSEPIPTLMYVSLGAMTLAASVGLSVFTLWGAE